jgi:predicted ATPase/transcriptional regulator with XRE-family HTH domain
MNTVPNSFARLLREHRREAGLSQEALAEHAGVSKDAISALERGTRRAPYRDTVEHLARALGLDDAQRTAFQEAAARGRSRDGKAITTDDIGLPVSLTPLVGRDRAVQHVIELLEQNRIVTVTGAGGVGKTRVSIDAAMGFIARTGTRAWLVNFETVRQPPLALSKMGSALRLTITGDGNPIDELIGAMRDTQGLLILDNCAHVVEVVAPTVAAIAKNCPRVRVLATSQHRLAVDGETTYRLPSLTPAAAADLFEQRVLSIDPDFPLTEINKAIVTDICEQVDGIPLAIELAAARAPMLGLSELRARLRGQLSILTGGKRDAPPRQRTMSDTLAFSYSLLDEKERVLFRRLAVFPMHWTLDAAESVAMGDRLERAAVLATLSSLVDKSLVTVIPRTEAVHFRFLNPTRVYALEQAALTNELPELSMRLAHWVAEYAERFVAPTAVTLTPEAVARQLPEMDNARAALEWSISSDGDPVVGARIVGPMRGCWRALGQLAECRYWCEALLARLDETATDPVIVAKLYRALILIASNGGEPEFAAIEHAIPYFERAEDWDGAALLTSRLALRYAQRGNFQKADETFARALAIHDGHQLPPAGDWATALMHGSIVRRLENNLDEAQRHVDASLAIARTLGLRMHEKWTLMAAAEVAFARGNPAEALRIGIEATRIDNRYNLLVAIQGHTNLAGYRLALDDFDGAHADAIEAIVNRQAGAPFILWAMLHLATVYAVEGNLQSAALLKGYVDARRAREGLLLGQTEANSYRLLEASLKTLGAEDLRRLEHDGSLLSDADASELALPV